MNYISHIGQDRWVAETLKHKRGGYFLDFGGEVGADRAAINTLLRLISKFGIRRARST